MIIWLLSRRPLRSKENLGRMMGESNSKLFFKVSINCYLLNNLLKRCDVKQTEKANVASVMLSSLLELIAAAYFFAFLFLDALNFLLRALACGLSLRYSMAVR